MKRLIIFLTAIVVLSSCNNDERDLNKDVSVPVSVMEIKPQSIEKYISTTATVKPMKEVVLKTEINKFLSLFHVLNPFGWRTIN